MSQLSKFMNMEKGSLTSVIDGLITKGLVKRVRDKTDRRKVNLQLSKQSEEVVRNGMVSIGRHIQKKMEKLTDQEVETLSNALKNILIIAEKL